MTPWRAASGGAVERAGLEIERPRSLRTRPGSSRRSKSLRAGRWLAPRSSARAPRSVGIPRPEPCADQAALVAVEPGARRACCGRASHREWSAAASARCSRGSTAPVLARTRATSPGAASVLRPCSPRRTLAVMHVPTEAPTDEDRNPAAAPFSYSTHCEFDCHPVGR